MPNHFTKKVPQHHVDPQKSASPYDIILSKNKIRGGDSIDVTIKGKSNDDTIKGFLVKAVVGGTEVGQFEVAPNDKNAQTLSCGNSKNVCLKLKFENLLVQIIFIFCLPFRTPLLIKKLKMLSVPLALNG
jgi:hypothetical protein